VPKVGREPTQRKQKFGGTERIVNEKWAKRDGGAERINGPPRRRERGRNSEKTTWKKKTGQEKLECKVDCLSQKRLNKVPNRPRAKKRRVLNEKRGGTQKKRKC